jgi:hypothetical protein
VKPVIPPSAIPVPPTTSSQQTSNLALAECAASTTALPVQTLPAAPPATALTSSTTATAFATYPTASRAPPGPAFNATTGTRWMSPRPSAISSAPATAMSVLISTPVPPARLDTTTIRASTSAASTAHSSMPTASPARQQLSAVVAAQITLLTPAPPSATPNAATATALPVIPLTIAVSACRDTRPSLTPPPTPMNAPPISVIFPNVFPARPSAPAPSAVP